MGGGPKRTAAPISARKPITMVGTFIGTILTDCFADRLFLYRRRIFLEELCHRLVDVLVDFGWIFTRTQRLGGLAFPDLVLGRNLIDVYVERADINSLAGSSRGRHAAIAAPAAPSSISPTAHVSGAVGVPLLLLINGGLIGHDQVRGLAAFG